MIIKYPDPQDLTGLKALWQEAFGDPEPFIEGFFRTGFSPERCRAVVEEGPVAALYWFDCRWQDRKLAYIYAVATRKDRQGLGLCRRLMEDTHQILTQQGYAGAVLVPAEEWLFALYGKLGYRAFCPMEDGRAFAAGEPVQVQRIDYEAYARAREDLLPPDGIVQDRAALAYLGTYCDFYAGPGLLFSAARKGDALYFQEFLGDTQKIPGILTALGAKKGEYRRPGGRAPLAMYRSLTADDRQPAYFGLPLD